MRLCTFEVSTHLGRHSRVGALLDGRIMDLNFATAWYLAQQGEAEPQPLADALVPSRMIDFLRAGLRATHTAADLFAGAGPYPHNWWKLDSPPRGPNDETLVYLPDQVRLRAPLPNAARLGTGDAIHLPDQTGLEWKLAAVIGKEGAKIHAAEARAYIAGFTAMNEIGGEQSALGPCLVTPDEVGNPYALGICVRINGAERARTTSANLRPKFENAIESLSANGAVQPGDVIASTIDVDLRVQPGDVIEFEIDKIGALRTRLV